VLGNFSARAENQAPRRRAWPSRGARADGDSEALEAELAGVRADTQAEVSHAGQLEASARRERMQADEAAEAALSAVAAVQE